MLALFDFAAAFPSVSHQWIWKVLHWRRMPRDFINLFKSVYANACAVSSCGDVTAPLIRFESGVLQGCPGSSILFNFALDPFLAHLHVLLRQSGGGIVLSLIHI